MIPEDICECFADRFPTNIHHSSTAFLKCAFAREVSEKWPRLFQ